MPPRFLTSAALDPSLARARGLCERLCAGGRVLEGLQEEVLDLLDPWGQHDATGRDLTLKGPLEEALCLAGASQLLALEALLAEALGAAEADDGETDWLEDYARDAGCALSAAPLRAPGHPSTLLVGSD